MYQHCFDWHAFWYFPKANGMAILPYVHVCVSRVLPVFLNYSSIFCAITIIFSEMPMLIFLYKIVFVLSGFSWKVALIVLEYVKKGFREQKAIERKNYFALWYNF